MVNKTPLTPMKPLHDASSDLLAAGRQCTAMSKRTGERCKNRVGIGKRTCRMHGSATRATKVAAAKRIAEASGYAADMLVEFMADPKVDVKLRTTIAQDLLSRAGYNGKTELSIDLTTDWQAHMEEVIVIYDGILEPGLVDAEVVDEEDNDERLRALEVLRGKRARKGQPLSLPSEQNPLPEASDDRMLLGGAPVPEEQWRKEAMLRARQPDSDAPHVRPRRRRG